MFFSHDQNTTFADAFAAVPTGAACTGRYRQTFTTTLHGCSAKTRLFSTSPFATL